jgi:hypothetical protein
MDLKMAFTHAMTALRVVANATSASNKIHSVADPASLDSFRLVLLARRIVKKDSMQQLIAKQIQHAKLAVSLAVKCNEIEY